MGASYKYKAMNAMGRTMSGTIMAENDLDLEMRLKQIGLELIDYRELAERKRKGGGKIGIRDMILLCLHLEQLMRAGVPILEAVADVRDSTESGKMRDVMTGVHESLKTGDSLSQSLAKYPRIFNEVFVGLIKSGEKTGAFTEAFNHLSEHLKWNNDIQRKVKKAVRYPIALLIIMTGVISALMIYLVPKLVDFMMSQGFDLPLHTRALIATSNAFAEYWYVIIGTPVAIGVFLATLYRTSEPFAYHFDKFMLKIPVIGSTIRKINIARFTHFFAVLFNSGIDILEAHSTSKNVVGNRVISESIDVVIRAVSEGTSLTNALKISNQFPNLVVRMFKVGEDSGNMQEALDNVNFFYHREVNDAVDNTIGMIQPALTIVMGLLILWVIAAMFGPLYQSFSKMDI